MEAAREPVRLGGGGGDDDDAETLAFVEPEVPAVPRTRRASETLLWCKPRDAAGEVARLCDLFAAALDAPSRDFEGRPVNKGWAQTHTGVIRFEFVDSFVVRWQTGEPPRDGDVNLLVECRMRAGPAEPVPLRISSKALPALLATFADGAPAPPSMAVSGRPALPPWAEDTVGWRLFSGAISFWTGRGAGGGIFVVRAASLAAAYRPSKASRDLTVRYASGSAETIDACPCAGILACLWLACLVHARDWARLEMRMTLLQSTALPQSALPPPPAAKRAPEPSAEGGAKRAKQ